MTHNGGIRYVPSRVPGYVDEWREVRYLPFPSQRRFGGLEVKFKGFSGPIGSGKSRALVYEAIKLAYLNGGCHGLIGAPTYRMLRDSTQIELLSSLAELGIPHQFHKATSSIYLPEPDATILLRTMDEPERLRAMNLAWFGIDELSYCKEDVWTRLEGRLRDPRAPVKRGFAVWTPRGKDWVWRQWISPRRNPGYHCIQARPFENRAILNSTPDYYQNLKQSYDERFYRQEVLGEYVDMFAGAVYHAFSDHNVRPCGYDPGEPLIIAMDFNVNPMAGAILQQHKWGRQAKVHVLEEIVLPSSHIVAWCQELVRRTLPWAEAAAAGSIELQFFGDAAGGQRRAESSGDSAWRIVEEFFARQPRHRAKFFYEKKNPPVADRVQAMNAMLCSFGQGYTQAGQRYLYIDPACRELLTDLEELAWKVDAHGTTYPEIDGRNPKRKHISDAVGYYIHSCHSLDRSRLAVTKDFF